jgi:hypothetical protein
MSEASSPDYRAEAPTRALVDDSLDGVHIILQFDNPTGRPSEGLLGADDVTGRDKSEQGRW